MKPLPLPVRIAAGLVATALEQTRDLPRLIIEFPVTAVSQALQVSMRVQQKVTELAIKGDRALGALRPVEDKPSWATFDDEEEPPRRNGTGTSTVTALRPPPSRTEPAASLRDPVAETATAVAAATTAATAAGTSELTTDTTEPSEGAGSSDGPNVLPGYRTLTIPQLRAKLRALSVEDLRALLAFEQAHDDRAPFVTMLTNRITTVTEG
jgi:hypothetical protein